MTKLLQCLRDELVRRDYAATTIRSYIQIVDACLTQFSSEPVISSLQLAESKRDRVGARKDR